MYEKVEVCPICEGEKFRNEIICQDHTVSKESFAIVSCTNCGHWITTPRPSSSYIGKYYESEEYISHSNKSNNLINFIYKIVRNYTLKSKVKLLKSLQKSGRVFDYGCGTGDFLRKCKDAGYNTIGLEPNENARKTAQSKAECTIIENISDYDKDHKADIITLWHVLEHIPDINDTVHKLRKRLRKGGYIILALPNRKSYDANHYKEKWAAYDVPRHFYHFDKKNISKLAKKHKLKVEQIVPQYFDSFYVSILSEKYSNNNMSFFRGIYNGLKSNLAAHDNNNEYSSLIYILKK